MAVTVAALLLPFTANPASAGCAASEPEVDKVVCQTVYPLAQKITCKIGNCMT